MVIRKIEIPLPKSGLSPIKLEKLGRVVALVGKNGSGKSRVLTEIVGHVKSLTISELETTIDFNKPLADWLKEIFGSEINPENQVEFFFKAFNKRIKIVNHESFAEIEKKDNANKPVVSTIENVSNGGPPKFSMKLKSPKKHRLIELVNAENIEDIDVDISSEAIADGLLKVANLLLKEDYQVIKKHKNEEDTIYYKHFSRFKHWVDKFLGTEIEAIDVDINPSADFNGTIAFKKFPYDFNLLSPGQRILLAYAFYFSLFEAKASVRAEDCIFIIDEPETHLHPETQILLIRALKGIIKDKGQLWIATHSIHIISELNYDEIFLVKEGKVHPPNRTIPGEALSELMGIRDNAEKLSEFISDTTKWAETNFVVQCLDDPNIFLTAKKNDPEVDLFIKNISSPEVITILDFGAGKARLGTALEDSAPGLKNRIALYDAFEPFENEIIDIFPKISFEGQLVNDINLLKGNIYDIVVLIGVLHEIDLNVIVESLNKAIETLKETGAILIIEDLLFPTGELP